MTKEIWKPVVGYEPYYEVSSLWRVKNKKWLIMKSNRQSKGYMQIDLKWKLFLIHRLVAQAFIPNPENKPYINHKDLNPENNNLNNLEWCTQSENLIHYHTYMETTNTIEEAYELGKNHKAESLSNVFAILQFIQSKNFTCDQLHQIALWLEDIKGSDYDDWIGYDDSDRSDELREYRDNQ